MRRASARLQCANNLRQIGLGLHNYADMHPQGQRPEGNAGLLPAGTLPSVGLPPDDRLSWFVELLPFIEKEDLYNRFDRQAGWGATVNTPAGQSPLKIFQCPDWTREAAPDPPYLTAYLGVAGVGPDATTLPCGSPRAGVFGYDRRTAFADITDGTATTLLILESARDNGPWARGGPATVRGLDPSDQPYLGTGRPFGGTHFAENTLVLWKGRSIGCNAVMADGSVHFFRETTAPHVLESLATAAGGETVSGDW